MNRASADSVLGMCGFGVRRELRSHYGSGEAAAAAVRQATKDTDAIEQWASIVTAKQERLAESPSDVALPGQVFRFSDIPAPMRPAAIECLAAAMLAWTAEQERTA